MEYMAALFLTHGCVDDEIPTLARKTDDFLTDSCHQKQSGSKLINQPELPWQST